MRALLNDEIILQLNTNLDRGGRMACKNVIVCSLASLGDSLNI